MMKSSSESARCEFGKNWSNFVARKFSPERTVAAKKHLLGFLDRPSLEGVRLLDVGCGSGLHSLAAFEAGVSHLHSFDYDPNSVEATRKLWERAGCPDNWT